MDTQPSSLREDSLPTVESQIRLKSMLQPGEQVVRLASISYGMYWKGLALLLFGVVTMLFSLTLGVYFIAVAGAVLLVEYGVKSYMLLAATNRRVIVRYGLINLQMIDIPFSRIESVETVVPLVGRVLGYANVVISGTGSLFMVIPFVSDAAEFSRDLVGAMEKKEDAPVAVTVVPPAPQTPPPEDVQHAA